MNTISKVIGTKDAAINYTDRLAVRVIVADHKVDLAIIHVKKGNYYKLPGGGIEADEHHHLAGVREAKEETGCKVTMSGDCFATTEVRETQAKYLRYLQTAW